MVSALQREDGELWWVRRREKKSRKECFTEKEYLIKKESFMETGHRIEECSIEEKEGKEEWFCME